MIEVGRVNRISEIYWTKWNGSNSESFHRWFDSQEEATIFANMRGIILLTEEQDMIYTAMNHRYECDVKEFLKHYKLI